MNISEIEDTWAEEVVRHIAEVEAGSVQLIPAAEVIASATKSAKPSLELKNS